MEMKADPPRPLRGRNIYGHSNFRSSPMGTAVCKPSSRSRWRAWAGVRNTLLQEEHYCFSIFRKGERGSCRAGRGTGREIEGGRGMPTKEGRP